MAEYDASLPTDNTEPGYIAYCGTLNESKDGVLTLMRAFSCISQDFPDVNLVLIGDSIKVSQIPVFRERARMLGIADRVDHLRG